MRAAFLDRLRCPSCSSRLSLAEARESRGEIESGRLECGGCSVSYPILRFIPRFVPEQNYADSFGFQWNRFRKTQLDSHTGLPISRDRFLASTGWTAEELNGACVLDVGCGAGRFAEIALDMGAGVTAVDYSNAVDACRDNLGPHPRLEIVQADVYRLPFERGTFDDVYCLGVLQHTPDVRAAFFALTDKVRSGGRIAVDVYPKLWRNVLWSKYWLRPFTRRLPQKRLFALVERMVRHLLPLSLALGRLPLGWRMLRYAVPVVNHEPNFPLSPEQVREWAVLDTFDMLAPAYDQPQSPRTLRRWLDEAGVRDAEVFRRGHLIGRGRK